jgi:hypothetical protein
MTASQAAFASRGGVRSGAASNETSRRPAVHVGFRKAAVVGGCGAA